MRMTTKVAITNVSARPGGGGSVSFNVTPCTVIPRRLAICFPEDVLDSADTLYLDAARPHSLYFLSPMNF